MLEKSNILYEDNEVHVKSCEIRRFYRFGMVFPYFHGILIPIFMVFHDRNLFDAQLLVLGWDDAQVECCGWWELPTAGAFGPGIPDVLPWGIFR